MLERKVSAYLNKRVKECGGEIRRVSWIGRRNAPDKLVMLPGAHAYVEEKRTGKDAEAAQKREHHRMARAGMRVRVIDSVEDVDRLLGTLQYCAAQKRLFEDIKPQLKQDTYYGAGAGSEAGFRW